jgi:hypothetical protein
MVSILVVDKATGRIGNILMTSAQIMAFAIEHNLPVINIPLSPLSQYFNGTNLNLLCSYPFSVCSPVSEKKLHNYMVRGRLDYLARRLKRSVCSRVPDRLSNTLFTRVDADWNHYDLDLLLDMDIVDRKLFVILTGWLFQSRSNLLKHGDKIREYFQPLEQFMPLILEPVRQLRKNCNIVIGLAIRQGDYRTFKGGKFFYATDAYIEKMHEIEKLFPDKKVGFFIASEEDQDENKFCGFTCILRSRHMLENMYTLSECDYIVTTPSTYATWASFYGKKPIFYISDIEQPIYLEQFSPNLDLKWNE